MKKASLHGLAFRSDVELDGDMLGAQISDSYKDFMSGAYCKMSRRHYRPIGADPEEREDGTHRNVNETIDSSVFDRWRDVPQYRPPNLSDWAKRKSVDLANFRQSVSADDPKIGAPD